MADMSSRERFFAVLKGDLPDRPPVDPMLESKFPMHIIGKSASTFYKDSKACTKGLIETWRRFNFDVIQVGCTLPQYLEAVSGEWSCPEDGYPMAIDPVFSNANEVTGAKTKAVVECRSFQIICEIINNLKNQVGQEVVICCRCPGTFNLMRHLIGTDPLFMGLVEDHNFIDVTADLACDLLIEAGRAFADAGADLVWYPDACSSTAFISPQQFEQFAMSRHARFCEEMKKAGMYTIYHPDGYEYGILCQVRSIDNVDIYHMSHNVDVAILRKIYGHETTLYGNIDGQEMLLFKGEEEIEQEIKRQIHTAGRHGRFVVAPNINMPGDTPPENLRAMIKSAQKHGQYPFI
jgi:uroporphyrinogen decarboxylase